MTHKWEDDGFEDKNVEGEQPETFYITDPFVCIMFQSVQINASVYT